MRKRILIPAVFTMLLGIFTLSQEPSAACWCDCQVCEDQWSCAENGSGTEQCIDAVKLNPCMTGECQPGCPCIQ